MNPADTNPEDSPASLREALSHQGTLLGQHDQALRHLVQGNQELVAHMTQLMNQIGVLTHQISSTASAQVPLPPDQFQASESNQSAPLQDVREVPVPNPEPFHGDLGSCRGFLLQCSNVFDLRPATFSTDKSKILFMVGLLRGRALTWAEAEDSARSLSQMNYSDFIQRFKQVFDHPDYAGSAAKRLFALQQGNRSAADYSVEFQTISADSGWNDKALREVFVRGLNEQLKDELASKDEEPNLNALISLVIRLDNRLRERRRERTGRSKTPTSFTRPVSIPVEPQPIVSPADTEEPMQLGRARLSPEERLQRLRLGQCLYCGGSNHLIATCPTRPKERTHQ